MSDRVLYRRKRIKKILNGAGIFIIAAFLALLIANRAADISVRFTPGYEKVDLKEIFNATGEDISGGVLSAENLSEEMYHSLLQQTGLGKDAVDKIFETEYNPVKTLEAYQDDFFDPKEYKCESIGIVTREERLYVEDGRLLNGYLLADVRNGDILMTKATHSVGWRHGHAAIVVDAVRGKTLEAVIWGKPSMIQDLSKWRTYPTFIQLRYKQQEIGEEVAKYAEEHMDRVDYGLLAGLLPSHGEEIASTQCSHLPWYVYMHFGIDLNSNGGWLVTPKDIVNSELLEIVQLYGVNPDEVWK